MDIDILIDANTTQTILFKICRPTTEDDDLALGLGLGLGLGIPALILLACQFYCCCIRPRRAARQQIQELQPREELPATVLFKYFGQNLHRQFNTGILTAELRAAIISAPPYVRRQMVAVAAEHNRTEILEFIDANCPPIDV